MLSVFNYYRHLTHHTGACFFLHMWRIYESHSVVTDSLQPHGLYSPWNSLGQNTGVSSLSLLQGIFPTQGSNPGLLHCRWILYQLSHKGSPRILEWVAYPFFSRSSPPRNWIGVFFIAGGFFTNRVTGEPSQARGNSWFVEERSFWKPWWALPGSYPGRKGTGSRKVTWCLPWWLWAAWQVLSDPRPLLELVFLPPALPSFPTCPSSPPAVVLLMFHGPLQCHLDLGSVFIVPSSGPLKSFHCVLPFIVFHLIFYVSCTYSSTSLDWKFLKEHINSGIFISHFPQHLAYNALSQAFLKLQFLCLLAMWSWTSHFISTTSSCLICKMGIMIFIAEDNWEDYLVSTQQTLVALLPPLLSGS